ncbi:MAG: RagB/SusD family nutrient uptake outer membrane protein [Chitinophagaceae bacterium]
MKLKKIIFIAFASLGFYSCEKVTDIQETDIIAGSTALKTVANCESAVIGAYSGFSTVMNIQLNFTLADEVRRAEFYNAGTTHEWQYNNADVGIRDNFTAISDLYRMIDRANRVIQALPVADSTRPGDIVLKNRLRGECLFLRAWAHFDAFRYYCGNYTPTGLAMPYKETPSIDPVARIQMQPYFQKLNADLAAAKLLVPNNLTDLNRTNVLSVAALQARVALYMNDWNAASTFATEFINARPLSPIASFGGLWTDANTNELSMRVVRSTSVRLGSLFMGTSPSSANISQVTWAPSTALLASYDPINDVRYAAYFRTEPLLVAPRPSILVNKYRGAAGTTYGSALEHVVNEKVFRTAEMVLIRAEARAELNNFTGANSAETDLNMLRAARIIGYAPVTLASKSAAVSEIMTERYKELAYEGHRFWDLKRKGLPVSRNAADAPTTAAATLPANNFRFLLPIPLTELNVNPLMQQNPGY